MPKACPCALAQYFGVFDGHTTQSPYLKPGSSASAFASEHLHRHLAEYLDEERDISSALRLAFNTTNRAFLKKAEEEGNLDGTTATVAVIQDGHMVLANLGDSAAVMIRVEREHVQGGRAYPAGRELDLPQEETLHWSATKLTHDHNPLCPKERARIEATVHKGTRGFVKHSGVWRVQDELAVSRAMGNLKLRPFVNDEPDISVINLNCSTMAGIIASDGLWDVVTPSEAADVVKYIIPSLGTDAWRQTPFEGQRVALTNAAHALSALAYQKMSMDNTAVVVFPLPGASGCAPRATGSVKEHTSIARNTGTETEKLDAEMVVEKKQVRVGDEGPLDSPSGGLSLALGVLSSEGVGVPGIGTMDGILQESHFKSWIDREPGGSRCDMRKSPLGSSGMPVVPNTPPQLVPGSMVAGRYLLLERMRSLRDPLPALIHLLHPHPQGLGFEASPVDHVSSGLSESALVLKPSSVLSAVLTFKPSAKKVSPNIMPVALEKPPLEPGMLDQQRSSKGSSRHRHKPSDKYDLGEYIMRGSHGEVWTASSTIPEKLMEAESEGSMGSDSETFVLKRILVEKGEQVTLTGMREVFFGHQLQKKSNIARFVEAFELPGSLDIQELWLVFIDEGKSLADMVYTQNNEGKFTRKLISPAWTRLRTGPQGGEILRSILRQVLIGVAQCHAKNITHRDIKPENLLYQRRGSGNLVEEMVVKVADFGSAVHRDPGFEALKMYGSAGPTVDDLTLNYAPPEVVFMEEGAEGGMKATWLPSYDIWSVGVVMLELIMGTSEVFQIDDRAKAIIQHRLRGSPQRVLEAAYLLRALTEHCVYPPQSVTKEDMNPALARLLDENCSGQSFGEMVRQRDPFGIGMNDPWGVLLLRRLLKWNPQERVSAAEALKHAYLREDGSTGFRCSDEDGAQEYEFESDMDCRGAS